ncbi:MAG: GTPase ObgE [Candidatus Schekmanbacteria bacterium]|nr:GTPase ObgE [Candidatus Schekmanbacteria bacterium]
MDFVDQVKIFVKAGNGGRGCIAFRREKYVPHGGPSGGDGGNGGDVLIKADPQLTTLLDLRYQKHYRAQDGEHGLGSDCHGQSRAALIIPVPVGSIIKELETGHILKDLSHAEDAFVIAKGGRGGLGNARFATAQRRVPRFAQPGEEGEEHWLQIELKLLADVGLIGYPNVGKSTLISRITAAHPKIADYPFTTLMPQLGVVKMADYRSFIVADIPGLIAGAHQGTGLGDRFLRHIERTKLLLHLVDVSPSGGTPQTNLEAINKELGLFNPQLLEKPQLIVATKLEVADREKLSQLEQICTDKNWELFKISAHTGEGLNKLLYAVSQQLNRL